MFFCLCKHKHALLTVNKMLVNTCTRDYRLYKCYQQRLIEMLQSNRTLKCYALPAAHSQLTQLLLLLLLSWLRFCSESAARLKFIDIA